MVIQRRGLDVYHRDIHNSQKVIRNNIITMADRTFPVTRAVRPANVREYEIHVMLYVSLNSGQRMRITIAENNCGKETATRKWEYTF
jgi:hypothetical protein